ncbi:MAG: phage holin family protein [Clostridiales bacterium]|nr:phage holin family protein [Clostridiales bacterium]
MNCIYTDNAVTTGSSLRSAVIYLYLSSEDASLPGNASRLGLPVPEKLREVLSRASQ